MVSNWFISCDVVCALLIASDFNLRYVSKSIFYEIIIIIFLYLVVILNELKIIF